MRSLPLTLPLLVTSLLRSTSNTAYLARYATIGAVAVLVDVATFQVLVTLHVLLPLTTTVAFALAAFVHFSLNKVWTFRVRGAPRAYQVTAYVTVLFTAFLITQLVVEIAVLQFHIVPVIAKIIAILVQLPVSFFGHRYFTFRKGRDLTNEPITPVRRDSLRAGDKRAIRSS